MNAIQYEIVKRFAGFPLMNHRKMAKVFNIEYMEVIKVHNSANFEQYQSGEPMDAFSSIFGGMGL